MAVSSQQSMATNLVKTMVYMPPELRETLEKLAKRENRSLSNLIVTVMQHYAEEEIKSEK
jgi:predicted DNA-binding protein